MMTDEEQLDRDKAQAIATILRTSRSEKSRGWPPACELCPRLAPAYDVMLISMGWLVLRLDPDVPDRAARICPACRASADRHTHRERTYGPWPERWPSAR